MFACERDNAKIVRKSFNKSIENKVKQKLLRLDNERDRKLSRYENRIPSLSRLFCFFVRIIIVKIV